MIASRARCTVFFAMIRPEYLYGMENSFIFAAALVNARQDEIAVYICYYELE